LQLSRTVFVLALAACSANGSERERHPGEERGVGRTIEEVLAARAPELMRIEGVEGVGEGLCDAAPCVRVYVRAPEVARRLPERLDGYEVSWVVTGEIRPRPEPDSTPA
jgi:hypothetical protein